MDGGVPLFFFASHYIAIDGLVQALLRASSAIGRALGFDRDLEDEGGQGTKRAVCADVEPLSIVAGDVFHVLATEASRGFAVDNGHVGPQKNVPDVDPLIAGGGGNQFADAALATGGWDGSAGPLVLVEVAVDVLRGFGADDQGPDCRD